MKKKPKKKSRFETCHFTNINEILAEHFFFMKIYPIFPIENIFVDHYMKADARIHI